MDIDGTEGNPVLVSNNYNTYSVDENNNIIPLSNSITTLSGVPSSMWQTLINLELIKARYIS